jgi:hypothetical protein
VPVRQREKIQEVLREVMEAHRIGMKKPARITRAGVLRPEQIDQGCSGLK